MPTQHPDIKQTLWYFHVKNENNFFLVQLGRLVTTWSYLLALEEPVPCLVLRLTDEVWLFMTVLTFEALSGDMGAADE